MLFFRWKFPEILDQLHTHIHLKPFLGSEIPNFFKVADLSPIHFRKLSATDGVSTDLNIGDSPGFGGLMKRAKSTTLLFHQTFQVPKMEVLTYISSM